MICERFATDLVAAVDGELTEPAQQAVDAHLKGCSACRKEMEGLWEARRLMALVPLAPPPADLYHRIMAATVATTAARPHWTARLGLVKPAWAGLALAAAAAGVLAVGLGSHPKPASLVAAMPHPALQIPLPHPVTAMPELPAAVAPVAVVPVAQRPSPPTLAAQPWRAHIAPPVLPTPDLVRLTDHLRKPLPVPTALSHSSPARDLPPAATPDSTPPAPPQNSDAPASSGTPMMMVSNDVPPDGFSQTAPATSAGSAATTAGAGTPGSAAPASPATPIDVHADRLEAINRSLHEDVPPVTLRRHRGTLVPIRF